MRWGSFTLDSEVTLWAVSKMGSKSPRKAQDWFGTIVEFVALKELRMPVRHILDSTVGKEPNLALSEILPSGLAVLVLTKADFVDYSLLGGQLRRLLDVRERQFSSLRNTADV
ncbi:hypothetical protein N7508_001493 [Penicillium antarcticum]|uniref:uncharacterized protein n=1 Tax=Penicillium antarcticum TaxID=416450 RepID=UPI0023932FC5|nr:uncharacterized protein N7508_001493 [Penicillium antarcticum]KAJ5316985.1 hypothetical protein N7508_001493 [Penicillium antarcticum]